MAYRRKQIDRREYLQSEALRLEKKADDIISAAKLALATGDRIRHLRLMTEARAWTRQAEGCRNSFQREFGNLHSNT